MRALVRRARCSKVIDTELDDVGGFEAFELESGEIGNARSVMTAGVKAVSGAARSANYGPLTWENNVSEGGLEPPCPFGALAPQASASAYSATRTWAVSVSALAGSR
jgi:hypothetical protein